MSSKTLRNGCVTALFLGTVVAASACSRTEPPEVVAERFWTAAQQRDQEGVRANSIESEDAKLNLEREDSSIEEIGVSEALIEGDQATVETRLVGVTNGQPMELSFETVLVQRDDRWLVDLDETSNRMIKSLLGSSLEEMAGAMGEAMAEGMQSAMEGVAEGMAEGMRQMGEAMGEAMKEAADSLGAESTSDSTTDDETEE